MSATVARPLAKAAAAAYGVRRRLATVLAVVAALMFGYHAVFGQNGITAYAKKREEDRQLKRQIETLDEENARLHDRVSHLQSDPDTVSMEARQRLHYARSGEVIYTLDKPMAGSDGTSPVPPSPAAGK